MPALRYTVETGSSHNQLSRDMCCPSQSVTPPPDTLPKTLPPIPHLQQALGRCAKSTTLDFAEGVRRALSGDTPGSAPPPTRGASGGSRRDSGAAAAAESKAEAKSGGDGGGGSREGTADSRSGEGKEDVGGRGRGDSAGRRGSGQSDGGGDGRSGADEKVTRGGGGESCSPVVALYSLMMRPRRGDWTPQPSGRH